MGIEQKKLRLAIWEMKGVSLKPVSRWFMELWHCGAMSDASSCGKSDNVVPPKIAAKASPPGP